MTRMALTKILNLEARVLELLTANISGVGCAEHALLSVDEPDHGSPRATPRHRPREGARFSRRTRHPGRADSPVLSARDRQPPHLTHLQVYDNSREAGNDGKVPDPVLLLQIESGRIAYPARDAAAILRRKQDWAKPLLESAYATAQR